jgi:hypothetical protein
MITLPDAPLPPPSGAVVTDLVPGVGAAADAAVVTEGGIYDSTKTQGV